MKEEYQEPELFIVRREQLLELGFVEHKKPVVSKHGFVSIQEPLGMRLKLDDNNAISYFVTEDGMEYLDLLRRELVNTRQKSFPVSGTYCETPFSIDRCKNLVIAFQCEEEETMLSRSDLAEIGFTVFDTLYDNFCAIYMN